MPHKTIIPDRDGWYWAIIVGTSPVEPEVVRLRDGRVCYVGCEDEDRPEDWGFLAGPLEPPSLD
jgi:hypothetical protein